MRALLGEGLLGPDERIVGRGDGLEEHEGLRVRRAVRLLASARGVGVASASAWGVVVFGVGVGRRRARARRRSAGVAGREGGRILSAAVGGLWTVRGVVAGADGERAVVGADGSLVLAVGAEGDAAGQGRSGSWGRRRSRRCRSRRARAGRGRACRRCRGARRRCWRRAWWWRRRRRRRRAGRSRRRAGERRSRTRERRGGAGERARRRRGESTSACAWRKHTSGGGMVALGRKRLLKRGIVGVARTFASASRGPPRPDATPRET